MATRMTFGSLAVPTEIQLVVDFSYTNVRMAAAAVAMPDAVSFGLHSAFEPLSLPYALDTSCPLDLQARTNAGPLWPFPVA